MRPICAPRATQHVQSSLPPRTAGPTSSPPEGDEIHSAQRTVPSKDVVQMETQLQAAIDGLFAAVAHIAQMVGQHPTPDKFVFEGSPLMSLLRIAARPASQHASTP